MYNIDIIKLKLRLELFI